MFCQYSLLKSFTWHCRFYLILPDIATLVSTCEVNLHADRSVKKAFAIDVILY